MFKVRWNKKSISAKINKALEGPEKELKTKLKQVASDLTEGAPVVTGAYADSFSVDTSGGMSYRRESSQGRPTTDAVESYRAIAYARMAADINRISLKDGLGNNRVIFKNGAPHATFVEDKYQVFGAVRDKHR